MTNLDSILKPRDIANKGPSSQSFHFSSSHIWMWELVQKESWALKNWCFWTVVLEKTLESPLDSKEIQPVHPKGNQSWLFIGKTDAEAETPILWPPDGKNWLIEKDPNAGKDWRLEEKGITEDKMVGWHHQLDGHEFEQAPGVGEGQRGLVYCNPWGCKESDTTEWLNWIHMSSLSWIPLPSSSPSHPSRLSQSISFGSLCHITNSHWLSMLHMALYMFQCYSLKSSPLLPLQLCPKICSLCLCLHCCPANRFIFLDSKCMRWYTMFVFLFLTYFTPYNRL